MTVLRVGNLPQENPRLRKRLVDRLKKRIPIYEDRRRKDIKMWISLEQILNVYCIDFITTPTRRGLLSSLIRSSPVWDVEDSRATLDASIQKELSATQQTDRSPSLYYPFFFSQQACIDTPMHHLIPHRPFLMLEIRRDFLKLKSSLVHNRLLLIPQCSKKSVGDHTAQNYRDIRYPEYSSHARPVTQVTQRDLEKLYFDEGWGCDGPCEVRHAWKYNDVKPRIYYAIGGTAYFASRYVHQIFDRVVKMNKATDPGYRMSFDRFRMISFPEDAFLIYDYTSFTSNLVDFPEFCVQLASFFKGVKVDLLDGHRGIVEGDIGEILQAYNEACNLDPEFSIAKLFRVSMDQQHVILSQHVAGLLGVFGNITGSTALHGIVGIVISGDKDAINAIGDDAGMLVRLSDLTLEDAKQGIKTIGEIADEKFEIWTEDQVDAGVDDYWHYTKRPITTTAGVVEQGWMPDFPQVAQILGIDDSMHTVQKADYQTRRRLCIKQVCRLFEVLFRHRDSVTNVDIEVTLEYLRKLYRHMRLPSSGSYPTKYFKKRFGEDTQSVYPDSVLAIPRLCVASIEDGWRETLRYYRQEIGNIISLPVLLTPSEIPIDVAIGDTFHSYSNRKLSYLVKMDVVEQEIEREDRHLDDQSIADFEWVSSRDYRQVYKFTVLDNVPYWPDLFKVSPPVA